MMMMMMMMATMMMMMSLLAPTAAWLEATSQCLSVFPLTQCSATLGRWRVTLAGPILCPPRRVETADRALGECGPGAPLPVHGVCHK